MINKHLIAVLIFSVIICTWGIVFCQEQSETDSESLNQSGDLVGKILDGIEKRYSAPGFSANFIQESTLKAMDISDTAAGTVKVKRPGMMIWEYHSPDPQTIITDGDKLWIYRPEDNQVMVGKAPAFFKDGKGAGFLSDMKLIREKFTIFLDSAEAPENTDFHLKLYPEDQSLDVAVIHLVVDPETYIIKNIVTYNMYDDETRIRMTDYNFEVDLSDEIFEFTIPKGSDVLEIE